MASSWVRTIKKACTFFNKDKKSQQGGGQEQGAMNLQGQVMACGYEDVQVMWSILDKSREDVKKALHARLVGVNRWGVCSNVVHYDMQNLEIPTIGVLGTLIKTGIRVLVYSGDQDSVLPFFATRTLVNGLAKDLGLNTTVPYRAWFEDKQVGGWTQVYGELLSFATIRGASHEAPYSQPERCLLLLSSFLGGKPLPAAKQII